MYEEHLLRDPYRVTSWLSYLTFHSTSPPSSRFLIYERALSHLPSSYKLWLRYLRERISATQSLPPSSPAFASLNLTFERCLTHLHKCPRVWLLYTTTLASQHLLTRTRHTFDRALSALPLTQHLHHIWPAYLAFALSSLPPPTTSRVYRRYLKVQPTHREAVISFLTTHRLYDDAALLLIDCIDDPHFTSTTGRSKADLWSDLLTLLLRHASSTPSVDTERIIRSGVVRFPNDAGRLWCALAQWHVRQGRLGRARDVYEEGMVEVGTVKDFTQIFDSYSRYEETLLTMRMRQAAEAAEKEKDGEGKRKEGAEEEVNVDTDADEDEDEELAVETDLELSMLRLEDLLRRRPLLLSSVLLRQNPHNVDEWLRRTSLFPDSPLTTIRTFTDAVTTISPSLASGEHSLTELWSAFARFYLQHDDLDNARVIYAKAVKVPFRRVEEAVSMYVEWVEVELKAGEYHRARDILASVCRLQPRRAKAGEEGSQQRVHRSTRLWALYADLEETLGTLSTTRAVYDAMIAMKVITPQLVLNYAQLLVERGYFEESFRVYEQSIALFQYPHVLVLWLSYLKAFISRYGGSKRERTRDLFEQCLASIPPQHSRKIYLLYAKFEEDHGLSRRAMDVYQRACDTVPAADRYALYVIYIARVTQRFGLTRAREVYEEAMQKLHQRHVLPLCLAYAKLEVRLGEVDRARALYTYVSQWADARETRGMRVWREWEVFEVEHGNEETYREMLRVKRSVAAAYASVGRPAGGMAEGEEEAEVQRLIKGGLIATSGKKKRKRRVVGDDGHDAAAHEVEGDEEDDEEEEGGGEEEGGEGGGEEESVKRTKTQQGNPEEIDIGDLDDDDDEEEGEGEGQEADGQQAPPRPNAGFIDDDDGMGGLVEKQVPDSLFGLQS